MTVAPSEASPVAQRAVAEARRWLGTPYLHQACCRGAGCDCLGLIRGIWQALYGQESERPPGYSVDWSEPAGEEILWQAALRHLWPKSLESASPGDVLLFRMRRGAVAKHLGVQTRQGRRAAGFIHAYSGRGVVESALTPAWQRRVVARFSFPEERN